ncbi:MAG: DUF4128 domain-containing protein [Gammaproteobacteria bacterium]|nr:DUF4128 domain-containing protein [Gammaproteobacteria bacterium]
MYTDIESDIFSVFGDAAWSAESVSTYPSNFIPENPGSEFLRVTILSAARDMRSASGQLIIDIFTPAGEGQSRAIAIADILDRFFRNKSLKTGLGTTQFFLSSIVPAGPDMDNPSLYRSNYSISFNYFGVQQ